MNTGKQESSGAFPTTQWTQVIAVMQSGETGAAWAALNEFCESYRPAVHNFFRHHGCHEQDAQDFTQEFFTSKILKKWAEKDGFVFAAQRGEERRFRSFLCHVLCRFLQDEWKHGQTVKRGGGVPHLPLDELVPSDESADSQAYQKFGGKFDREFAWQIIQRAAERSNHSKYILGHFKGELSQKEAARELGQSENTFKAAFHRFRERLALDLWDEVAKLVGPNEDEIRAEIRYLMSLFAE